MGGYPNQNAGRFGFSGGGFPLGSTQLGVPYSMMQYGGIPYGGMFPAGMGQQQANPMTGLARYSPYSPLNMGMYQSPFVRTYQVPQVSFQRVSAQQNAFNPLYHAGLGYAFSDLGGPGVSDGGIGDAPSSANAPGAGDNL